MQINVFKLAQMSMGPMRIEMGNIKLLIYRNYPEEYQQKYMGLGLFKSQVDRRFRNERTIGLNLPLVGISISTTKDTEDEYWEKTTCEVNVKAHPFPIFVDKCLGEVVPFIDSLKRTKTTWCCCKHGHPDGSIIVFVSKLPKEELTCITDKYGGELQEVDPTGLNETIVSSMKGCSGWNFKALLCKCSEKFNRIYWGDANPVEE